MTRTFRFAAGFLALAFLSACATSNSGGSANPNMSRALQIAKAADLVGLRDVEAPKGESAPTPDGSGIGAGLTYGSLNYLAPPPGFGSGMAAGLGFATFFFSGPSAEEAATMPSLWVWMPKDQAQTEDEAWEKINDIIQTELDAVIAETTLPAGYSFERVVEPYPAYQSGGGLFPKTIMKDQVIHRITGGICDDEDVRCGYQITATVRPREVIAPAVLGGGPAWGYVRTKGMIMIPPTVVDDRTFRTYYRSLFADMEVLRKLSRRLPDWMVIYIAPNRVGYADETGKPLLVPYPVMLRKGEPLYFVKGN